VAVFTGAGVSAESGIPTFATGRAALAETSNAQSLATPEAFERDPAFVWGWYEWRRSRLLASHPNRGPSGDRAAGGAGPRRLTLITQNVDDLHERAGSREVLHLHGRICSPYCKRVRTRIPCAQTGAARAGVRAQAGAAALRPVRRRVRPGVVWFGESLPRLAVEQAVQAAQGCGRVSVRWDVLDRRACCQPARVCDRGSSVTIQVNIDSTWLDDLVTLNLCGPAASMLPELVAEIWPQA